MRAVFVFSIIAFFLPVLAFAQSNQTESLTITTYYPSPNGVYRDLEVWKNMTFKPHINLPSTTGAKDGTMVFVDSDTGDANPGKMYVYSAGAWQSQAGEASSAIYLNCGWGTDYTAGTNHGWDGSCTPPLCPAGWTSAAVYSEPIAVACSGTGACTYSAYTYAGSLKQPGAYDHPVTIGRSVRVCVK